MNKTELKNKKLVKTLKIYKILIACLIIICLIGGSIIKNFFTEAEDIYYLYTCEPRAILYSINGILKEKYKISSTAVVDYGDSSYISDSEMEYGDWAILDYENNLVYYIQLKYNTKRALMYLTFDSDKIINYVPNNNNSTKILWNDYLNSIIQINLFYSFGVKNSIPYDMGFQNEQIDILDDYDGALGLFYILKDGNLIAIKNPQKASGNYYKITITLKNDDYNDNSEYIYVLLKNE